MNYIVHMKKVLGIVLTNSFHFRNNKGNYLIDFTVQVDRKEFIFGEINVRFISTICLELKIGEKVLIYGSLLRDSGFIMEATSITRLPLYS